MSNIENPFDNLVPSNVNAFGLPDNAFDMNDGLPNNAFDMNDGLPDMNEGLPDNAFDMNDNAFETYDGLPDMNAGTSEEVSSVPEEVSSAPELSSDFASHILFDWCKNDIPDDAVSIGAFRDIELNHKKKVVRELKKINRDSGKYCHLRRLYDLAIDTLEQNVDHLDFNKKIIIGYVDIIENGIGSRLEQISFSKLMGLLHKDGFNNILFAYDLNPDPNVKDKPITFVVTDTKIGLSMKHHYTNDSTIAKYRDYIRGIHNLFDMDISNDTIDNIIELEKSLIDIQMKPIDRYDYSKLYNRYRLTGKGSKFGFNYKEYLKELTGDSNVPDRIIIENIEYMKNIMKILRRNGAKNTIDFLVFNILHSCAPWTSKESIELNFDMFNRTILGIPSMHPSEIAAVNCISMNLPETLDELFIKRLVDNPNEIKEQVTSMCELIREQFIKRLKNSSVITDKRDRLRLIRKVRNVQFNVAYPDTPTKQESYKVHKGKSLMYNIIEINRGRSAWYLAQYLGKPVDRKEWYYIHTHVVNAFYDPLINSVFIPIGILSNTQFDINREPEFNYAGIGTTIGHELGHAIDNMSIVFNEHGKFKPNWLTDQYLTHYKATINKVIKFYNRFSVNGKRVNGELNSFENMADIIGLNLALDTLYTQSDVVELDLFFESYAHSFKQKTRREKTDQLIKDDPHAPRLVRINGSVMNSQIFQEHYQLKKGDPMYRNVKRIILPF